MDPTSSTTIAVALVALVGAALPLAWRSRPVRAMRLYWDLQDARKNGEMRRALFDQHGWTDDERETYEATGNGADPAAWRSARLGRLARAMCTGLPPVVAAKMDRVIEADPARAAQLLDDEDTFRRWVYDEGIVQ